MSEQVYAPPLDKLVTLGNNPGFAAPEDWPNYPVLYGLGAEHIPELIRLANDTILSEVPLDANGVAPEEEGPEIWAQIHAVRALAELNAQEAIPGLLPLFTQTEDNDVLFEELPIVYGMLGAAALQPMSDMAADLAINIWQRTIAISALEEIATRHPQERDAVVAALMRVLENYENTDEGVNAFAILSLTHLKTHEALPLMEQAFAANKVDESVMGDWEKCAMNSVCVTSHPPVAIKRLFYQKILRYLPPTPILPIVRLPGKLRRTRPKKRPSARW